MKTTVNLNIWVSRILLVISFIPNMFWKINGFLFYFPFMYWAFCLHLEGRRAGLLKHKPLFREKKPVITVPCLSGNFYLEFILMTILSQLVYFFKSHSLKVGAELLPRGDRRGKKKVTLNAQSKKFNVKSWVDICYIIQTKRCVSGTTT